MQLLNHNSFYFWRMLWGSLCHAEWAEAYRRAGIFGWIAEFFRAITGFSAWPFFVPRTVGWTPDAMQALLATRGIVTWGWDGQGADYLFHTKMRQAHWAQYLLLEAGVPLSGRLLGGNGYGVRRRRKVPTGHQSPQGGYRPARLRPLGQPEPVMANAAASGDPVDRVNRLVERLAGW